MGLTIPPEVPFDVLVFDETMLETVIVAHICVCEAC